MTGIDLRSDTVTQPTAAMRAAMAAAPVGDDVYGEDPTVNALQEEVADLLGTEAALWTPTGTMANQIALRCLVRPSEQVICGAQAHCWRYEAGALAALAGAQTHVIPGDGRFTEEDVRAAYVASDMHASPTTVVSVENTHNMGGGLIWDPAAIVRVQQASRDLGMSLHQDGARLWNAAVASARPPAALAAGFDLVTVCLSKGLGAPAGSLVAGHRDLVRQALRYRKMYGGAMRQIGVLAAAGRHALAHHLARLADDHAHAQAMATSLRELAGDLPLRVPTPATNIVMIDLPTPRANAIALACATAGVRIGVVNPTRLRAVWHLDAPAAWIEPAAQAIVTAVQTAAH